METLLNPTQGILYRNVLIFRCDCSTNASLPSCALLNHGMTYHIRVGPPDSIRSDGGVLDEMWAAAGLI